MNVPILTIVAGRPGAGKTTLAHRLAQAIRCPAICRDELKEGLVHTVQQDAASGNDLNRQVNAVFFHAIELLLLNQIMLVAEAAFQHHLWLPRLEPLQAIAHIRLVICSVDPLVAQTRCIQRGLADPQRERYHGDPAVQAAKAGVLLPISPYNPPHIAVPTLTVDTTAGYWPAFEAIVAFAVQHAENPPDAIPQ